VNLRASLLNLWHACPLRVWMVHTHGWARPSGAMFSGTCAHAAVEKNLDQKIETFEDISQEEFDGAFEELFDKNRDPVGNVRPDWRGEDRGDIKTAFLGTRVSSSRHGKSAGRTGLLTKFHSNISPQYQPDLVEAGAAMELQDLDGNPFTVTGTVDFIGSHQSKTGVVADWKFRKRMKSSKEADQSDQLTTYALLLKNDPEHKMKVSHVQQVVSVHGGVKPDVHILSSKRTAAQVKFIEQEYKRMHTAVSHYGDRPELYPMASPDQYWGCSESWCGFWKKCPRGGGDYHRSKKIAKRGAK